MHTLVSAFEDGDAARRAVKRLVDAGFAREDVHLEPAPSDESPADADADADAEIGDRALASAEREVAVGHGALDPIVEFFARLFGGHGHADTYSEAVRRGHSVVVVDAGDEAEAERAALILHELGAVDVDERAAQWRAEGWDPASQPLDEAPGAEEPRYVVNEAFYARTLPVEGGSVRVFQRVASVREVPGRERDEGAAAERGAMDRSAQDPTAFEREAMGRPGSDEASDMHRPGDRTRSDQQDRAYAANRRDESAADSQRPEPDDEGRAGTDKPAR